MKGHRTIQSDLGEADDGVLVGRDDRVVGLRRNAHKKGAQHMHEEEHEGEDP